ncbi:hypothetical protein QRQ56_31180 [Bradyrhizobium sp. U531]|uniref:hypothetical protein n=1 Tax=Bradyrhizobium sp. U531 TaxID=3053458 RepID=UPI003F436448
MADILEFSTRRGPSTTSLELTSLLGAVGSAQQRTVEELGTLVDGLERAAVNFLLIDGLSPILRASLTAQAHLMESARVQLRDLQALAGRDRSAVSFT